MHSLVKENATTTHKLNNVLARQNCSRCEQQAYNRPPHHQNEIRGAVGKYPDFSCYLHMLYMSKNYIFFFAYISVSFFLMRSAYTRSLEHLNKAGVRATLDSKLEEQRSVIKFLLFEGVTFFKGCRNDF